MRAIIDKGFTLLISGLLCALLYVAYGLTIRYRKNTSKANNVSIPIKKDRNNEPSFINVDRIKPFKLEYDWRQQPQSPYRPWKAGPYHVTMGLKQADVEDWIELDETYLDKYYLKRRLFEHHRDEVLCYVPGYNRGLQEAVQLLKETLVRKFPTMFKLRAPHIIENSVTGDVWDLHPSASTWEKHHPLEVMSLLATEDFLLLENDPDGQSTLKAAVVCFPAGFKIESRIGLTLWQIHAGNVPQYETKLAKSMDRFFSRLKVEGAVCRFNYAIDVSGELFHRHSHHNLKPEDLAKPLTLDDLHLRVERQVLQRLPNTRALLFTIRTYVTPLAEVTRDKDVARALRGSVGGFTEDVAKYKNRDLWIGTLQRHLTEILGEDEKQGVTCR